MSNIKISPVYISAENSPADSQNPLRNKFRESLKKLSVLLSEKYAQGSDFVSNTANAKLSDSQNYLKRIKRYFKKSYLLPGIVVAVFLLAAVLIINNALSDTPVSVLTDSDQRIEIKKAKAKQIINKEFLFPLKNQKGQEVSKLKFFVETADLRDEIIVKGKRATSVKGRTFLVINFKITNDYNQAVSINSRDYFRLMVNNNNERLAPDVHSDPVEVQPISTKYTRIGLPINDTDKNLILQVGEINGNKQNIKLDKLQ